MLQFAVGPKLLPLSPVDVMGENGDLQRLPGLEIKPQQPLKGVSTMGGSVRDFRIIPPSSFWLFASRIFYYARSRQMMTRAFRFKVHQGPD